MCILNISYQEDTRMCNKSCAPVGIVHIIYDSSDSFYPKELVSFLEERGYQVVQISSKFANTFKSCDKTPVFLLGGGHDGKVVQDIIYKNQHYSGAISVMANMSWCQRWFYKTRMLCTPKIPLMIIGGWNTVKQMQYHVNNARYHEMDLHKLILTVYPDIKYANIFDVSKNDLLSFLQKFK